MADSVYLSFFQGYNTIIAGISYICDSKTVLKLILWIFTHYMEATRLHIEYSFSPEVVDSQQWRMLFFFFDKV